MAVKSSWPPEWLKSGVLVAISIVWFASFLVDLINPGFEPDPYLNFLMASVIGVLYGQRLLKNARRGGEE